MLPVRCGQRLCSCEHTIISDRYIVFQLGSFDYCIVHCLWFGFIILLLIVVLGWPLLIGLETYLEGQDLTVSKYSS